MGIFSKKKPANQTTNGADATRKAAEVAADSRSKAHGTTGPNDAAVTQASVLPQLPPLTKVDPDIEPVQYLKSLSSIRDRSMQVYAQRQRLRHFHYQENNLKNVVQYVLSILKRDYGTDYGSIPPHGRWQHFEVGGRKRVDELLSTFTGIDELEKTRRIVDLFLVSVLLDAGAGNSWKYKASNGKFYRRSEGLAVASLEMFQAGMFSTNPKVKTQVDAAALENLSADQLGAALQVSAMNPMSGLEGRCSLLTRLASALSSQPKFFGTSARPGHLVDYLLQHPSSQAFSGGRFVSATVLWDVLLNGLSSIWPAGRSQLAGIPLGDVWKYEGFPTEPEHAQFLSFHKLTQWLAYSLMAPITKFADLHFAHTDQFTGLPEYRNGGLFVDLGVLTLKKPDADRGFANFLENGKLAGQQTIEVVPLFDANDDVIVEWRAMTVCLLDKVHSEINKALGLSGPQSLSLPQILEAGTWKAGREIAEVQRPNTKGSPIAIRSDGTVF